MVARKKTIPQSVSDSFSLEDLKKVLTDDQINDLLAKKEQQNSIFKLRQEYEVLAEKETLYIVSNLIALEQHLIEVKTDIYKRMEALIAKKRLAFSDTTPQKSFEFTYEGKKLVVGYSEIEGWLDTATSGITKVEQFLSSLAKDETTQVVIDTLTALMKKTKKNQLRVGTLVSLENLLDNEILKKQPQFALFKDGVETVRKAWKPKVSCWSVRASVRDAQKKERAIATSLSSAKFASDFDFKGF